jgi:hypothetical protein
MAVISKAVRSNAEKTDQMPRDLIRLPTLFTVRSTDIIGRRLEFPIAAFSFPSTWLKRYNSASSVNAPSNLRFACSQDSSARSLCGKT